MHEQPDARGELIAIVEEAAYRNRESTCSQREPGAQVHVAEQVQRSETCGACDDDRNAAASRRGLTVRAALVRNVDEIVRPRKFYHRAREQGSKQEYRNARCDDLSHDSRLAYQATVRSIPCSSVSGGDHLSSR